MRDFMFVLHGDKFKSTREDMHFHRDMTYTVSKVFRVINGIKIFMTDKYGYDYLMDPNYFDNTAKTSTLMQDRQRRARIQFMIDSRCQLLHTKGHYYDWEQNSFYEIERAHYIGDEKRIGTIKKYKIEFPKSGGRMVHYDKSVNENIYKEEDFYNYFDKNLSDDEWYNLRLPGITNYTQESIDHMKFMDMEFISNMDIMHIKSYDLGKNEKRTTRWHEKTYDDFEEEMSLMIFDAGTPNYISHKQIMKDIMILYRELPSSHSGTSISKILTGKSKINNSKVNHLIGKYTNTLKQPQMYELASEIESFLFQKGIFMTKEEYSSGTEWRGDFEFIGSKYINETELNKLIA